MPLSRQQQHQCNRPHPTAAFAAMLLLPYCIGPILASPINERPGNVLTMILADCGKYQNWLSVAAAFAWRQSGQPGSMIRVANCAPNEANDPGSLKIAQYVKTFIAKQVRLEMRSWQQHCVGCVTVQATHGVCFNTLGVCCHAQRLVVMHCRALNQPEATSPWWWLLRGGKPSANSLHCCCCVYFLQYTWYEPLKDHYPAYNKPGAVVDYFAHHNSTEDWVVILDSDMLVKNPFLPEELLLDKGWAYAAGYSYLKGVNNNLALRNVPEVVPR